MDGVTPGIWTLKPGDEGYDEACRAAMMACGVDPDGFGTYKSRLSAQGALRKKYGAGYQSAAALDAMGPNDFLTANSESGHMCQNACFTGSYKSGDRRVRDDPCMNYPPTGPGADAPSAFGYDCNQAPCTDHHGTSATDGTTHGHISMVLDKQWPGDTGQPLSEDQLRQSVEENAAVHVDAEVLQKDGTRPQDPDVQRIQNAQQANAERMLKQNPDAAALIAANPGTQPGDPSSPSSGGPSKTIKNFAAKCQVTKWEQGMAKMRKDAINKSPIGRSPACRAAVRAANNANPKPDPKIRNFTDLPPEQQRAVVAANQPPSGNNLTADTPPGAPAGQNINPPQPSVGGAGRGTPPNTPTRADCRAHQGNYLAWQMANNGGNLPPWSGQVPPCGGPRNAEGGSSTTTDEDE